MHYKNILLATGLLAVATFAGCNATASGRIVETKCLKIKGGQVTANCDLGTVEYTTLCAEAGTGCGEFDRFTLCVWVDSNNDGKMQDGEKIESVDDPRPGDEIKVEAGSTSFPPGTDVGDQVYTDTAIYKEGQDAPVHSKRRCSKIKD